MQSTKIVAPEGLMHLNPIHHKSHPKTRADAFMRLHESGVVEQKMHKRSMLSPIESLHRLMEGNKLFARKFKSSSITSAFFKKKLDAVIVVCSDARMGGMLGFDSFVQGSTAVLSVAGNVAEALEGKAGRKLVGRLKRGGIIAIIGHGECGAVKHAPSSSKMKSRQEKNLHELLCHVDGAGEKENVQSQVDKLRQDFRIKRLMETRQIEIVGAYVNMSRDGRPISIIAHAGAAGPSRKAEGLISSFGSQFFKMNKDENLMEKQYAHTIALSDPGFGFTPRSMASMERANEMFSISIEGVDRKSAKLLAGEVEAAESGVLDSEEFLSKKAIASAEYSVLNNRSSHIVIIHDSPHLVEKNLLKESEIILNAVIAGDVEITSMRFNRETGELVPLRHLVSEKVALD